MILFWLSFTTFLIWPLFRGYGRNPYKTFVGFLGDMEINQKDISKLTDLYLDVIPFITFHTIKQCFYQESHPTKNVVLHSVMGNKYANNDITLLLIHCKLSYELLFRILTRRRLKSKIVRVGFSRLSNGFISLKKQLNYLLKCTLVCTT